MNRILLPLVLLPALAAAAPKLVCDQPAHDFGEAPSGAKLEHVFVLRNAGDEPLRIDRVQPSCGCTVAEVSRREVEPGGQFEIKGVLDLTGRRGPQPKNILVYSNDPARPQFRLDFHAMAVVELDLQPAFLFLPSQPYGTVSTGQYAVVTGKDVRVNITSVTTTVEHVTARLVEGTEGRPPSIAVRALVPEGGPLSNPGRLVVRTDHPRFPELSADFTFNVLDTVSVVPGVVHFTLMTGPNARPPVPLSRVVRIRPGTVTNFKVTEAVFPGPENKKGRITHLGPQGYQIQFDNVVPSADLDGQHVVIKTNVPGKQEIRVPIRVNTYGNVLDNRGTGKLIPVPAPPPGGIPAGARAP
jgi:hypothetical protein